MKYTNEIVIEVPRDEMIRILDNADNMKHWQRGLQSYSFLEGEPGHVGAKMKLEYQMGKRQMELVETITKRDWPREFCATYETKGVWNLVENHFHEESSTSTRWVADCEFKFSGMMRIMSWFMPTSMFQKQSCQYLEDFKAFAEKQYQAEQG